MLIVADVFLGVNSQEAADERARKVSAAEGDIMDLPVAHHDGQVRPNSRDRYAFSAP